MKLGIHTQKSSPGSQGTALQSLNLFTAEISRDSLSLSPRSQSFQFSFSSWGSQDSPKKFIFRSVFQNLVLLVARKKKLPRLIKIIQRTERIYCCVISACITPKLSVPWRWGTNLPYLLGIPITHGDGHSASMEQIFVQWISEWVKENIGLWCRLGSSKGFKKEIKLDLSITWKDLTEQKKGPARKKREHEYGRRRPAAWSRGYGLQD